jgi:hypothetical protein
MVKIDAFAKSRIFIARVTPAKAGIKLFRDVLDPGFGRGDDPGDFLRVHQFEAVKFIRRKGKMSCPLVA